LIWILGKQRELNEAKRTLQQVPFKTGLNERDIMRLGVGHFIVCTDQFAKIVYVWPSWLPEDLAVKVAKGESSVEEVIDLKSKLWRDDEELVWKEKYESLMKEFERAEQEMTMLKKTIEELKRRKPEEIKKPETRVEISKRPSLDEAQLIVLIDERLNQRLLEAEEIRIVNVDVDEKIKDLVKDDFISAVISKIESLPEPAKKAARYIYEKHKVGIGDLYFYLYQKTGRPPGSFYNNVTKPLESAALIRKVSGEIEWAMDDLLLSRFKDFVESENIESMHKYLLSLLL